MSSNVSLYSFSSDSSEVYCFFPQETLFNILRRPHVPELLRLTQTCTSAHRDIFGNKTLVRRIVVRETQGLVKKIKVHKTQMTMNFIVSGSFLCPDDIPPMQREDYLRSREVLKMVYDENALNVLDSLPSVVAYYKRSAVKNLSDAKEEAYREGTESEFARILRSLALRQIFNLELRTNREIALKTLADIENVKDTLFDFKGQATEILFYHDLEIVKKHTQASISVDALLQPLFLLTQSISNQKQKKKAIYALFKVLLRIDFNRAKEMALAAEGDARNRMALKIIEVISEEDSESAQKTIEEWFSIPKGCQPQDARRIEQFRELASIRICCGKAKKNPQEAIEALNALRNNSFQQGGYHRLSRYLPKEMAVALLRDKLSENPTLRDDGIYRLSRKLPLREATEFLVENLSLDYFRMRWETFVRRQTAEIGFTQAFLSTRKIESLPLRINALLGFYKVFFVY